MKFKRTTRGPMPDHYWHGIDETATHDGTGSDRLWLAVHLDLFDKKQGWKIAEQYSRIYKSELTKHSATKANNAARFTANSWLRREAKKMLVKIIDTDFSLDPARWFAFETKGAREIAVTINESMRDASDTDKLRLSAILKAIEREIERKVALGSALRERDKRDLRFREEQRGPTKRQKDQAKQKSIAANRTAQFEREMAQKNR